jgi:hypothetical protein
MRLHPASILGHPISFPVIPRRHDEGSAVLDKDGTKAFK